MRLILNLVGLALVCLGGISARAAALTQVRLVLSSEVARPGNTVLAGIHLHMDPEWHTYWKNPGGTGKPTEIRWRLPPGITAGETQWPVPSKHPDGEFTTYIYENDATLLVPLTLGTNLAAGSVELKATVTWLECKVQCVPGTAEVKATLEVGLQTKPSDDADLFVEWQKLLPLRGDGSGARSWWESAPNSDKRPLVIEWNSNTAASEADFYPGPSAQFEVQPATDRLPADANKIRLRKVVRLQKAAQGEWPRQVAGVLVQRNATGRLAYDVVLPVEQGRTAASAAAPGATGAPAAVPAAKGSLWKSLCYAFLGGLILNIMPCVLPVIALKILGFVNEAKNEPRRVRNLGFIYALGVIASFLVLAGLVIGVRAAGRQAGWGMQFGNPQFLVVLTVLVTLVALNLFGLFEVILGGRVMDSAGALAAKHGAAGAFFNGVLATALATPCTAPFLSFALGFAFAQPPATIALVFVTIGLGLAFPYVLLSWHPGWLKFLPKPGPWMEKFKIAMGFPMLATAIWLLSLIPIHYGARSWWLGVFLVFVALSAWIYGEFFQRGRTNRGLALAISLVLLGLGYAGVLEGRLHWRVAEDSGTKPSLVSDPDGIRWLPWSTEAVAAARAERRPVLVDFTASWCLTCNTIVKPALENPQVRKRLEDINAVSLLADNSKTPPEIAAELQKHGSAGVPLVLVYPKNPEEPVMVLPEPSPLLPPSRYSKVVLDALQRAVQ